MKRRVIPLTLAVAAVSLALIGLRHWPRISPHRNPVSAEMLTLSRESNPYDKAAQATTNSPGPPVSALGLVPGDLGRLATLETLGRVPEDATSRDWWLAQQTSWWGKRIDPKKFWSGRVVWLDHSAWLASRRQGRIYPPMPYEDAALAQRSDTDEPTQPGVDSPEASFRLSDRERAFWDKFAKTHPAPPDVIADQQRLSATQMLGMQHALEYERNPARTTQARLDAMRANQRRDLETQGYPPEAFSDEALHWTYVLEKWAQYQRDYVRAGPESPDPSNFLAHVFVDSRLVTNPPTEVQEKAANAWKFAYLQRLRRENTDESYINAYLKAWNLSAADVFKTNGP